MNILLFGPPGAGKGTQSTLFVQRYGVKHISTGMLFRQAIDSKTSLGLRAQGYMRQGDLVPDAIVIDMLKDALYSLKGQSFVLDGFPRTVVQAKSLEQQLLNLDLDLGRAIFLDVPEGFLMRRILGRRICRDCGFNYHIESFPPKKEGQCDHCGGEVTQRADDCESAIRKRLEIYRESTTPLMKYFEEKEKLVSLDGTGSAEDVFGRIVNELKM